jgi:hypothetical protein
LKVALFFVVTTCAASAVGAAGCADTDPNYGSPESIRGRSVTFPGAEPTTPEPAGEGGTTTVKTPAQLFGELYNGVGAATGIKTTCAGGGCHSPAGGGVTLFVATDEAAAYVIFKEKNYKDQTLPQPKGFFTKGGHSGPALTAAQLTVAKAWAVAETAAGGGTTPVADAATD